MKNRITLIFMLAASGITYAQVGVNTSTPKATFDITAKSTTGTTAAPEGLLIPRVDRQKAQSMTGVTTSTMIYINSVTTGSAVGTAVNINAVGYYYFDGAVWIKINAGNLVDTNIYNQNGSLTGNRVVTQNANTLAFNSTAINGFSVDGNTLSVDAANNRVGIGTVVPNSTLQVLGGEMRVGGDATQAGSIANPVLRIHSNANADGSGGELRFSENDSNFGYYLRHNTAPGAVYGYDGLAIGAAQNGRYTYNPAKPGFFIGDNQNVSVGTSTPQAMFHIDGARDNNINVAPTAAQQANDIVVDSKGSVGIGTVSPDRKLDIRSATNGAVRIQDGTQGNGYVLTSDAGGIATWKRSSTNVVTGTASGGGYNLPFAATSEYKYTGASIQLPPGQWMVTISQLIYPTGTIAAEDWMFVRSTFSEQNLTTVGQVGVQSADVAGPSLMSFKVMGPFNGGNNYDTKTGSIRINNNSNATKTYRYIVGSTAASRTLPSVTLNGYAGGWAENSIYATAIN